MIDTLIDDVRTYDFPAVSGISNRCDTYKAGNDTMCSYCKDEIEHPNINVILDSFTYLDNFGKRSPYVYLGAKGENYAFLTTEFQQNNQKIFQCFFQGHSLCTIRKDIFDKYGCKSYIEGYQESDDFAFAVDLLENCIPQFADLRIYVPHDARFHKELLVGRKEPILLFKAIGKKSKLVGGSLNGIQALVYVPILICTPFNNEDQSMELYIQSLLSIDYPKKYIDLVWVENDSNDNTWVILKNYAKIIEKKGYNSFKLVQQDYGLKHFGKSTMADFKENQAGKNKVTEFLGRVERGKRLSKIYHYFFDQLQPEHKYIMFLFADVVVPMQIIKRYLQIFKDYPDAGWVGGVHHKRFPLHMRSNPQASIQYAGVAGPLQRLKMPPYVAYVSDEWILKKQLNGQIVFEVAMTGHAWMMLPEIYTKGGRTYINNVEIVMPLVEKIWELGLKVYCASDIYLQHISLDGKIYRRNLLEELEYHAKLLKDAKREMEILEYRAKLLQIENKQSEKLECPIELPKEEKKKQREEPKCSVEPIKEEKKQNDKNKQSEPHKKLEHTHPRPHP